MMHYTKGENVEKETTKEDLPFEDCMPKDQRDNFLWMHVRGGTKVNNVISFAKNALEKGERTLVWSGSGGGLVKTVSCAEIIKRSFPLYQLTRMCHTTVEEHWKPKMEGLEEIVVSRKIPCLHILMSLDSIDVDGVQKPNTVTDFWHGKTSLYRRNNFWQGQKQQQQQQQKRIRNLKKKRFKSQHEENATPQHKENSTPQQAQHERSLNESQDPSSKKTPKQQQNQNRSGKTVKNTTNARLKIPFENSLEEKKCKEDMET